MGKKGSGSSWLTAVKRAFRSPSKELSDKSTTRNCRRKQDDNHHEHEDEADNKKKEKRRWLFRKGTAQESQPEPIVGSSSAATNTTAQDDQRHAIAVAVATAAAEAAVATAQAAMEAARITTTTTTTTITARQRATAREHYAATVIQTAFRSYLARRALRALKGLVKLQALVRGHNVRRQAKMTLKCMQALVRVQESVLDQRVRLRSHDGSQKSTFSDTASLLDSRYAQDIFSERKSVSHSRETSSIANGWDERPHTVEEVKAMLQSRRGAVAAAYERDRSSFRGDDELDQDKPRWLDRWMATRHWEGRASVDHCRSEPTFKTVEMDTSSQQQLPYTYLQRPPRRTHSLVQQQHYQQRPASPIHHRAHSHSSHLHQQSPATPSPSRTRPIQVRSASPRCLREDVGYHGSSQTPSLQSNYHYNGFLNRHNRGGPGGGIAMSSVAASYAGMGGASIPNYMAATESAKARIRSQSAPRQRPSTPERDRGGGSVKKRLSFPVPPAPEGYTGGVYGGGYSLRSPSFKSMSRVQSGYAEQQSIYTSCYTDSLAGGDISPSSTSEMRRWLT